MTDRMISRDAGAIVRKALAQPYITVLLGPRQVGKSTLLGQLLPPDRTLSITFDSGEVREKVSGVGDYLLRELETLNGGPLQKDMPPLTLCIDEAQKLPESFERIKELHDRFQPGLKVVLSGSSSLLIKQKTAETLAGRVRFFHLHPFSLREAFRFEGMIDDDEKSGFLDKLMAGRWTAKAGEALFMEKRHLSASFRKKIKEWLLWGLLPSRLHFDSEREWILLLRDYVDTYIEKDMRATERIGSLGDYRKLIRVMGEAVGNLVNYSKIASSIGIHRETVKEYLQILDESLLGFRLEAYSESIARRVTKAEKSFLMDNGLAYYFMDLKSPEVLEASGRIGALYENFLISEFRKQAALHPEPVHFYYWRLSGPNPPEVDLVSEARGVVVPVEMKCKETIQAPDLKGVKAFFQHYGAKKSIDLPYGVVVHQGDYKYLKTEKIHLIPDWFLAF